MAMPDVAVSPAPSPRASERSRAIEVFELDRALALVFSDFLMLVIASCIAVYSAIHLDRTLDLAGVLESALIFTAGSMVTFRAFGLYRISYALDCKDEWYYVILGLTAVAAPLLLLFTAAPSLSTSRLVLFISFIASVVLVGMSRAFIHNCFARQRNRRKRRVALISSFDHIAPLARAIEGDSVVLNVVPVRKTEDAIAAAIDEARSSWYDEVKAKGCDEMIFAGVPTQNTAFMVERAARDHITVGFAPEGFSVQAVPLGLSTTRRQPIIRAGRVAACEPANLFLKRLFDIAVASVALVMTAPIILGAMLAIYLESGGPLIFRQTRIGRNGKPFEILKLRSMVQNAEARCGPVWAVGDPGQDVRTTKVGAFIRKTSIDELPQFFNVLRGDMSVVGPRPERPPFVERFRREHARYDERHLVRPGITGWAHVHMRRSPGLELLGERLDLDLFYIENYSLILDIFITFKTGVEVLFQRWY